MATLSDLFGDDAALLFSNLGPDDAEVAAVAMRQRLAAWQLARKERDARQCL